LAKAAGIVDQLGGGLNGAHLGASLGDAQQHRTAPARRSLDRIDQIGNQVGAALVLIQHLRPGGLDLLILGLDGVVAATGQQNAGDRGSPKANFTHEFPSCPSDVGGPWGEVYHTRHGKKKPRVMSSGHERRTSMKGSKAR
jgi:hypothetical protein